MYKCVLLGIAYKPDQSPPWRLNDNSKAINGKAVFTSRDDLLAKIKTIVDEMAQRQHPASGKSNG